MSVAHTRRRFLATAATAMVAPRAEPVGNEAAVAALRGAATISSEDVGAIWAQMAEFATNIPEPPLPPWCVEKPGPPVTINFRSES